MAYIIQEKQDLTHLSWSKIRNSSGTAGSFLKAYDDTGEIKEYYKLSNFDSVAGVVGHESVNEIIVDRLLTILGVPHLNYGLVHADIDVDGQIYETWVCVSEDFKKAGESKVALEDLYEIEKKAGESKYDFCVRNGWKQDICRMLVIDFLIMNRDRHGANIEILRDSKKKALRMAPLFDHGISLLYQCHTEEDVEKVDISEEKRVQCYFGISGTTKDNLSLIPKDKLPIFARGLEEQDRDYIFEDLDKVISKTLQDKIWHMIQDRWRYYESFRDSQ